MPEEPSCSAYGYLANLTTPPCRMTTLPFGGTASITHSRPVWLAALQLVRSSANEGRAHGLASKADIGAHSDPLALMNGGCATWGCPGPGRPSPRSHSSRGKWGPFMGCLNYPRCRSTQRLQS